MVFKFKLLWQNTGSLGSLKLTGLSAYYQLVARQSISWIWLSLHYGTTLHKLYSTTKYHPFINYDKENSNFAILSETKRLILHKQKWVCYREAWRSQITLLTSGNLLTQFELSCYVDEENPVMTVLSMVCLNLIFTCRYLTCISLGRICLNDLSVMINTTVHDHHWYKLS